MTSGKEHGEFTVSVFLCKGVPHIALFCVTQNAGVSMFSVSVSLHLPNNRLESISIFHLPLFNSVTKTTFLMQKNIGGTFAFPPRYAYDESEKVNFARLNCIWNRCSSLFLHSFTPWQLMGVSCRLHVPAAFPQVVSQCFQNRRLCRPQIRSGQYEEEINLLPLAGIELRLLGRQAYILFTAPVILKVNRANTPPPYCYLKWGVSMTIANIHFREK